MSDWTNIIANYYSPEQIQAYKKQYAKLMLKFKENTDEIFKSTEFQLMFDGNTSCLLYAHNHWYYDKEVLAYILEIGENGYEGVLPSSEKVALEILERARNAFSVSESVAAYKLYLEVTGGIGSGAEASAVQNVIVLGEDKSAADWSEDLLKNQQDLQIKAKEIITQSENESETKH